MKKQFQELEEISEFLMDQMKHGKDAWEMPWHKGLEEPFNAVTGKVFRGRNATILWARALQKGLSHNQWATLKQWSSKRAKVRPGAKGVRLFVPIEKRTGNMFLENAGGVSGFRSYHVFNVADARNYNPDHPDLFDIMQGTDEIGCFIDKVGANMAFEGDRACYIPAVDLIKIPQKNRFRDTSQVSASEGYYSTVVHEIIHWTNHPERSPRVKILDDDQLDYAFEELVAELGSAIICTRFSSAVLPRPDHAAYLKSWLEVLENDFSYFYKALYLAQDAVHWLYQYTDMAPPVWAPLGAIKNNEADSLDSASFKNSKTINYSNNKEQE